MATTTRTGKTGNGVATAARRSNGTASKNGSHAAASSNGNGATAQRATTARQTTTSPDGMLEAFFLDEIKDIYWAEKHLVKTLPKLKKAASSPELQQAFDDHLEVTNTHVSRLEQVFEIMGKKAVGKKCAGMTGLTEEGTRMIEETEKGTATRDAALIMAAQKVEHYEIATYGCLAQLARTMGYDDIADILDETLQEEKEADVLLSEIAVNAINCEASEEEEE